MTDSHIGETQGRIRKHYEWRISPQRDNYDILDWASEFSQQKRFEVLTNNVDIEGARLLDVGSGLGDLLGYLRARGIVVDYTGVDITPKMVEQARRHQPTGTFVCGDIFGSQNPFKPGDFDVVFCSGTLNLNLGNNLQFMPHALATMFNLCRKSLVVNLLHHRCASDDDTYFYHNPLVVLSLAHKLDCTAKLLDDYLPNDFTVILNRPIDGPNR